MKEKQSREKWKNRKLKEWKHDKREKRKQHRKNGST
jgi:hypothetical protein